MAAAGGAGRGSVSRADGGARGRGGAGRSARACVAHQLGVLLLRLRVLFQRELAAGAEGLEDGALVGEGQGLGEREGREGPLRRRGAAEAEELDELVRVAVDQEGEGLGSSRHEG